MTGRNGLVLAYGNPLRGDDGIGFAAAEYLQEREMEGVTIDMDYQLCLEDAMTVADHDFTVFIDAAVEGEEPFTFAKVDEREDPSVFSHSLEPERVMGLANRFFGKEKGKEGYLLGIRGYDFSMFSEGLTEKAQNNLKKAMDFIIAFLNKQTQTGG